MREKNPCEPVRTGANRCEPVRTGAHQIPDARDVTMEYFDMDFVYVKMLNTTCCFNPAPFHLWLEAPKYQAQISQDISQVENIERPAKLMRLTSAQTPSLPDHKWWLHVLSSVCFSSSMPWICRQPSPSPCPSSLWLLPQLWALHQVPSQNPEPAMGGKLCFFCKMEKCSLVFCGGHLFFFSLP